MEDFDVKKEVKVPEETFKPSEEQKETVTTEEPEETITDTEEEEKPVKTKEVIKYKNKINYLPIVMAFILGISLTMLYFNFNPQGITEEEISFKIIESNINTIVGYTNTLCETANVTIFETNNPEAIPFMTYNGNNISAKSMNVNDACDIYHANKEAQS